MSTARGLRLSSGRRCALERPCLPGLKQYYVVALPGGAWSPRDVGELQQVAHRVGRMLAARELGDPECYTLLYNAARTRRRLWPHVHLLLASSIANKRRSLLLLQLKHVLRWRRWPPLRW